MDELLIGPALEHIMAMLPRGRGLGGRGGEGVRHSLPGDDHGGAQSGVDESVVAESVVAESVVGESGMDKGGARAVAVGGHHGGGGVGANHGGGVAAVDDGGSSGVAGVDDGGGGGVGGVDDGGSLVGDLLLDLDGHVDGGGVVAHGHGGLHVLHHGGHGLVGVALHGGVGEVAAQALALDDGAVVGRGAQQGGGGDEASGRGGDHGENKDGDLRGRETRVGTNSVYYYRQTTYLYSRLKRLLTPVLWCDFQHSASTPSGEGRKIAAFYLR